MNVPIDDLYELIRTGEELSIISILGDYEFERENLIDLIYLASQHNKKDVVGVLYDMGANDYEIIAQGAAFGGHKGTVNSCVSKGARDFKTMLFNAAQGNQRELFDHIYFLSKYNFDSGE